MTNEDLGGGAKRKVAEIVKKYTPVRKTKHRGEIGEEKTANTLGKGEARAFAITQNQQGRKKGNLRNGRSVRFF